MNGKTLMMLKPRILRRNQALSEIKSMIERVGCRISNKIICKPGRDFWVEFYEHNSTKDWFPDFLDFIDSEEVVFLIINGPDRGDKLDFETWFRNLFLPLRNIYGQDSRANAFHMSDGKEMAKREVSLIIKYELGRVK